MERKKVYEAIDSEREYQDNKWDDSLNRTVDEFTTYILHYTNQLVTEAILTDDNTEKINIIRKIGALAVACGERHGMPKRDI